MQDMGRVSAQIEQSQRSQYPKYVENLPDELVKKHARLLNTISDLTLGLRKCQLRHQPMTSRHCSWALRRLLVDEKYALALKKACT